MCQKRLVLFVSIMFLMVTVGTHSFAATIYVDKTLSSNCTSGNYSIANRSCSGSDGNAYKTVASGVAAMSAGDTLSIRGGTYYERQINLGSKTAGTDSKKYTIKSYPGEWAVIDGQHGGTGSQRSIFYGTGNPMAYIVFENLEITGGGQSPSPPDAGAGIFLSNAKYCEFRSLYLHDNYSSTVNVGAAAGIIMVDDAIAPHNNLIEYCYLKCNGNPGGDHNSANANIAIFSDYKYEQTVTPANTQHNNVVRYCLMDGSCSSGYNDVGIMQKGMQRLTGYNYGEAANAADNAPNNNAYRTYGDQYHHNIIIGHRMGARLDQDYVQFYSNIIFLSPGSWSAEETAAIELRDGYTNRRGPYYACVYNNTIFADNKRAIDFHLIPDDWNCNTRGQSCSIDYGFSVNNIIDTANTGYDWGPLSFDSNGVSNCTEPNPLDPATLKSSRNLFYRCSSNDIIYIQDRFYTQSEIEATGSADNVYKQSYDAANLLYVGTTGADKYKTRGSHTVEGSTTIANGGMGGSHPYLSGVSLPSYVGATDPNSNGWVDDVLNLVNLPSSSPDSEPPSPPTGLRIIE